MATRRYNLPGGNLTVTPPDPMEVALKQAQLTNLQGQPMVEQAKIDAARQEAARLWSQLLQQGEIARGQQTEETRYHTGTLEETRRAREAQVLNEQRKLAEETRYHTGTIGESQADREARVKAEQDRLKSGYVGDVLHALSPTLGAEATAEVASQFGVPEIKAGLAAFNAAQARQKGEQIAANVGKGGKPEQLSALLTGQTDKALTDAAWNAYKAANPTVLGPPPTPATTSATTAVAAPTPPAQVRTDRGLVNPSMGLVEATTGKVLPIPGSTPGIDYTGGTTATMATTPTPSVEALTKAVATNVPTSEQMTPTPAPLPTPVAPSFLSFNDRPIPISVGLAPGPIAPLTPEELAQKRRALATYTGAR